VEKNSNIPILKLIFFIIDWNKTKVLSEIFNKKYVRFHFICKGKGTANSNILNLLGIGSSEKAIISCLELDFRIPVLLKEVSKKLSFHSAGTGIAFTIPLSAINNPVMHLFKEENLEKPTSKIKKGAKNMANEIQHDLIVAAVIPGYSEELMATAREAGARGGTIINARSATHEGTVKFFGISVQEEKEIVIILTTRKTKAAIMQAVSRKFGLASEAKGIVFSLPVEQVTGLDLV
jgi:hypothetical protein